MVELDCGECEQPSGQMGICGDYALCETCRAEFVGAIGKRNTSLMILMDIVLNSERKAK